MRQITFLISLSLINLTFGQSVNYNRNEKMSLDNNLHSNILNEISGSTNKKNVRNNRGLGTSSGKPNSNAYNFQSLYSASVDPRTGTLGFQVNVGNLVSNNGFGPNLELLLQYQQSSDANLYGFGKHWSLNLTHYDADTQKIRLSDGSSFKIENITRSSGLLTLQYEKMHVLSVYKGRSSDSYFLKIVYKDGHLEFLNHSGYLTKIESPRGDCIQLSYSRSGGVPALSSIQDDQGDAITFTRTSSGYTISHKNDANENVDTRLFIQPGLIAKITLPVDNKNIVFAYQNNQGRTLINRITYPTGSWDGFTYTRLVGPTITGRAQYYEFAVNQHIQHPKSGASNNDIRTTYDYNLVAGHNYLAKGANVPYSSSEDLLFSAPANYEYGTRVSNGKQKETYQYNKFHLLTEKRITNNNNQLLLKEDYCYIVSSTGTKVCGDDSVSQTIDRVPGSYSLPVEQDDFYYTPETGQYRENTELKSYDNEQYLRQFRRQIE